MIIGISGVKGSGKSTVGKILQWQALQNRQSSSYSLDTIGEKSGWEIKQFAGKLKQMVCLLMGCSMEELEDPIFKETALGEEWKVYRCWQGSYEDSMDWIQVEKPDITEWLHPCGFEEEILTPRKILQLLGTEGGRELIHPNLWINALMSEYKTQSIDVRLTDVEKMELGTDKNYIRMRGLPNWIVTDVRFPNEVQAIKDRGGILIRVEREISAEDTHFSETALDNYKDWDHIIENNGTIEELKDKVEKLSLI